jgi:hypothetical protein
LRHWLILLRVNNNWRLLHRCLRRN